MTEFSVDVHEVFELAGKLDALGAYAYEQVDKIVFKGAMNVKKDLVADASKSPHFRALAQAITFEHENTRGTIRRVVGPDKDRFGGPLGNIFYFGTSRGGGSGDLDGPLAREEPRMDKAIQDLASDFQGQL